MSRARLDAADLRLVEVLAGDPRMSARALGRAIGMSPTAVGERLERLQRRGVIRGFQLDVDPAALGFGLEVVVAIQLRQGNPVEATIETLRGIPEVRSIQLVTGTWDLLVMLLVRDQHHLTAVLLGRVWSVADFQHSESMIVLRTYRDDRPLVLDRTAAPTGGPPQHELPEGGPHRFPTTGV